MKEIFIEWTINIVNFLIYLLIFFRAIGTACFSVFDFGAALVGVSAGVLFLASKVIKSFNE